MGAVISAIGSGINTIISAIAGVIMAIVGAVTTIILTIWDVITDILCCRCCSHRRRRYGSRWRSSRRPVY